MSKYQVDARGAQVGVIGDHVHVEGGIHLRGREYDVEPSGEHTGNIYRSSVESLKKPILIGVGSSTRPTHITGSLAGYEIETEDYVFVQGSVCGLQKVIIGKYNFVQGTVAGGDVKVGDQSVIQGSIFSQRLTLAAGVEIRGHIVCQSVLDSNGHPAPVLPPIKLRGILACDQSLELTAESQITGIISTRDVHVASRCSPRVVVAKGSVYLAEDCYVSHIQCGRLIANSGAKVAFACVEQYADLGGNTDIGFLYCGEGMSHIGEGSQLWCSTLISRHRHPAVPGHFLLNKRTYSQADALGISSRGEVIEAAETSPGVLYTNWINRRLLTAIGNLIEERLFLPTDTK